MDFLVVKGGKSAINPHLIECVDLTGDNGVSISVGSNVFVLEPGDDADKIISQYGLKKPGKPASDAPQQETKHPEEISKTHHK